jgi:hypothetical protein
MGERAHEALQGTCGDGYDTGYAEGWQAGYEAGSLVRLDRWAGDWREAGASIVGGIQAVESRRRAAERADLDAQSWDADTELARCAASWGIFEGAGA